MLLTKAYLERKYNQWDCIEYQDIFLLEIEMIFHRYILITFIHICFLETKITTKIEKIILLSFLLTNLDRIHNNLNDTKQMQRISDNKVENCYIRLKQHDFAPIRARKFTMLSLNFQHM